MTSFRTLLIAAVLIAAPAALTAGVFVSINIAPPVLPVYVQPPCPTDGYLWTPGYWAYGGAGYYWVPGAWVAPPQPGLLWTPGYWGFANGLYGWNVGYWGPHVGFYGGVNYGYGYTGSGFWGGRWNGGRFYYNTSVMHVNNTIVHNVYNETVVNNGAGSRASFNGPGGVSARPSAAESAAAREQHIAPTSFQASHERSASSNRANFASVNHGNPAASGWSHAAATHAASSRPAAVASRPAPAMASRPTSRPASTMAARPSSTAPTSSRPAVTSHASNPVPHANAKAAAPAAHGGHPEHK